MLRCLYVLKYFEAVFQSKVSSGELFIYRLFPHITSSLPLTLYHIQQVNPVTHAVGNTIKRVVIIVASVIAFKTPMSTGSIVGSSIAIAGTLMYSLAMNGAKNKKD